MARHLVVARQENELVATPVEQVMGEFASDVACGCGDRDPHEWPPLTSGGGCQVIDVLTRPNCMYRPLS